MKYAVVYYSMTSNNRCLALRIAQELGCEAYEIKTMLKPAPLLMFLSAIRVTPGIRKPPFVIGDCDCIVMCGPIWMGMLIAPLRAFVRKYRKEIRRLCFATCCGSGDDAKLSSFGYEGVFENIRTLLNGKPVSCEAFPVELVYPDGVPPVKDAAMKTRISDADFKGKLKERFDAFIAKVKAVNERWFPVNRCGTIQSPCAKQSFCWNEQVVLFFNESFASLS
ncbi:MAG TPA: hypothetical protein PKK43_09515 [Spirochaetota bacterium]|nr:hypothetical protein [Spirochaetota bacterium]